MQWWIDTVGKLGPGLIALLVLFTTRSQNRWQNITGMRSAQVEDQKLRLALLERRLGAIDAVREAVGHFNATGEAGAEARGKLIDALRVTEVVFGEYHERAITDCIKRAARWSYLNRRLESTDNEAQRSRLIDSILEADQSFSDGALALVKELIDGTRVVDVPPLQWPQSTVAKRINGLKQLRPVSIRGLAVSLKARVSEWLHWRLKR